MNIDSSKDTKELLFQSCKDGSLATVQQLMTQSQHSDLRTQLDSLTDDFGNTALIVASENGHSGIVKLLLECGANANKENSTYLYSGTPLTKISERGDSNLHIVDLLLRHGAQVDLQIEGGNSALIVAAQYGQTKLAAKLIREYRANINLKNKNGWTALMMASWMGCTEVAKLLLSQGAEVDNQDNNEWTALIIASYFGKYEIVKLLLKFGANVNVKADNYETALILASQEKHMEIVELLIEYEAKDDQGIVLSYVAASKDVHIGTIKLVLQQVTSKADDHHWMRNAVNGASENGRIDIVKLLLENGADDLGWALVLAILNKHNDIVELLLKHGALVDDSGWSHSLHQPPLVVAVEKEDADMVKLLLEHGAKHGLGWAITKAILNEHAKIIQILSEYGAQADDSELGLLTEPTLVIACRDGNSNVVKLLLEHGARKHLGLALTEAILNGHTEIIQLLSEYGAQVDDENWNDDFHQPPLVIAVENEDIDMVKRLLEYGAKAELGWAITEAIWNEQTEIVHLLSEHGAQVDDDDYYDRGIYDMPILVKASRIGNLSIIKLLLRHGASDYRRWALTEAILQKNTEVIDLLLEHGICVADEGCRGESGIDPAIVEASKNGDIDSVNLLLKYGEKEDLESALSVAATTEIAELLIEHGAKIDEIDEDFDTIPLVEASEIGNTDVVELLLIHGTKNYLPDALITAIANEHTDVIKLLTQHGAHMDDENWFDSDVQPALVEASTEGDIKTVKLLLEHGAEKYLDWALEVASKKGHIKIIKLLLDHGVQINDHNILNTGALVEASKNGDTNTVRFLLEQGVINRLGLALRAASGKGHTHIVNLLFEYANAEDLGHALIEASQNDHTKVIKFLIEHDVFVDFQDGKQTTALIMASQSGHTVAIKLLSECGAQINHQNRDGTSAMILACQYGHIKAVKVLLQLGALVNMQDKSGLSALMIASQNGHAEITEFLLASGAKVDLKNNVGWSPLMKASQHGYTKIVELLLKHGANVNLQADDGYHSLMAASQANHVDVVKVLLKYGANINLKDSMGQSAATVSTSNDDILSLFASVSNDELGNAASDVDLSEEMQCNKQEEEAHLVAIENAIKETGTLDHTLVHGVFVGPPRSGKDSLMKRLLGEVAPSISPSTGVLETAIHVKVEESCTYAATIGQSSWTRLAYDEEALHLMKTASSKPSTSLQFEGESTDIQLVDPPTAKEDTAPDAIDNVHNTTVQTYSASDSQPEMDPKPVAFHDKKLFQIAKVDRMHKKSRHKTPMEIFKEAITKKGLEDLRNQLTNSWSLYLTNTGGQMEFQELLPLLVSGPSIFFITFQLHKDLNECFQVEYELSSGRSSKCYQSSLNILDSILQTLSTIAAMGTFVYKGLQKKCVPLKPKVFLIGTHKDLLNKESAAAIINDIDSRLQNVIKSTSHYREEMIQFASKSQMIFTVSNHDPSDSDFQKIRSAVEKIVERGDYKMRSPAHWMVYSLVVRQLQNRVESYDDCFTIARECGIKDANEFNEALHFIHTKMGLIRYFPHEELKDLVIVDPQILFEKVTELIVETFTFENLCHHSQLEAFKNMGIFNLKDFTRISSRTGQNLTPPLFAKLLEYLRIAAQFQQSGETKYFLPCALTHARAKQSDNTSKIPSLVVTFQYGYCPKGLFGILITYLIDNEMESEFEWELDTKKIYRDEVCFQVGPYDTVIVRFLPTHLEIKFVECAPEIPRINCTVESICQEIYQSVNKGIKTATSAINYISAQHSFTFYCTSESCGKDPHPAKLKKLKEKLCSLKCDKLNKVLPLPSGYEKWQLDSSPQISKIAASLPHSSSQHTESGIRLEKQHLTRLCRQLNRYASKWKEIGTYLGFHSNELSNIAAIPSLYHEGPKGFLWEMLSEWLEWAPGDHRGSNDYANLEALKTAVSSAGLGATAADLAVNLHTKSICLPPMKECSITSDTESSNLTSTESDVNIHGITSSEKYLYSATKCVTPNFLDEIKDVNIGSLGGEHKISGYDITVKIREGSIPKGKMVHFRIGAALNGPFRSSSGKRPISPILWLCPEGEFTLSKPIEVILPHILTNVTAEDVVDFGIQVAKANHGDSPDCYFMFKPFKVNEMRFISNTTGNYVVMKVTHSCFICLEANRREQMTPEVAQAMAKKMGYCMHCIECFQSPYPCSPPKEVIYFCTSYFLEKCIKAVKDQYPERNVQGELIHRVHPLQRFTMNGSSIELKYFTERTETSMVNVALSKGNKIDASSVDFWESRRDIKEMEIMHDKKMYPPSTEMTVQLSTQVQSQQPILSVSFEGCATENGVPQFQFILPIVRRQSGQQHSPSFSGHDSPSNENGTSIVSPAQLDEQLDERHLRSILVHLNKHASKWRTIGLCLGFQSGELDNINATMPNNPPGILLSAMLSVWFEWAPGDRRGSTEYATLGALRSAVDDAGCGRTARTLSVTTEANTHASTARDESTEEPRPKRPRLE